MNAVQCTGKPKYVRPCTVDQDYMYRTTKVCIVRFSVDQDYDVQNNLSMYAVGCQYTAVDGFFLSKFLEFLSWWEIIPPTCKIYKIPNKNHIQ